MQRKLEQELKTLEKIGIPNDVAHLIAYAKLGRTDLAEEMIEDLKEIQDDLSQVIKHMRPFNENPADKNLIENISYENMSCEKENITITYHDVIESEKKEENEIICDSIEFKEKEIEENVSI